MPRALHSRIDNDDTRAVVPGAVDGDGDLDPIFGDLVQSRLYVNDGTHGTQPKDSTDLANTS